MAQIVDPKRNSAAGSTVAEHGPDHICPSLQQFDATGNWPFLDRTWEHFATGAIPAGMEILAEATLEFRSRTNRSAWEVVVAECFRKHPLFDALLLDPFTARSFHKPRGYPGDAVLLDLIYGFGSHGSHVDDANPTGRAIYEYSTGRFAPKAVRWRCQHIAQVIDELAQRRGPLRILSVASGHAREMAACHAACRGGISEFVALDADAESLEVLAKAYGGLPITVIHANATALLQSSRDFGSFDLVYSLGLFDYIPERAAKRIVAGIGKLLRRGGCAIVANFAPSLPDTGYMEAFMDWWLIYRDERDLRQLCPDINGFHAETYRDPSECLAFLKWTRS